MEGASALPTYRLWLYTRRYANSPVVLAAGAGAAAAGAAGACGVTGSSFCWASNMLPSISTDAIRAAFIKRVMFLHSWLLLVLALDLDSGNAASLVGSPRRVNASLMAIRTATCAPTHSGKPTKTPPLPAAFAL